MPNEHREVKCSKCGEWWPKSYMPDGVCWNCDGRRAQFEKEQREDCIHRSKGRLAV